MSNNTSNLNGHKRCSQCGEEKPSTLNYFRLDRGRLRSECRECSKKNDRQYYAENRAKIREYKKQYHSEHSLNNDYLETRRATSRSWDKNNPERKKENNRRHYEKNKTRILARTKEYKRVNSEKSKEQHRLWAKANPLKRRAQERRRDARHAALPCNFTSEDEGRALEYWHGCCAACGNPLRDLFGNIEPHMDHWIALSDPRCPGTTKDNMIPLCSSCNQSKQACDPVVWITKKFGKRNANTIILQVEKFFQWMTENVGK